MQYNYRNKFLVVIDSSNKQTSFTEANIKNVKNIDSDVYVYKYEICKFDQSFISFQLKHDLLENRNFVQ